MLLVFWVMSIGLIASLILSAVVAAGWVNIRARTGLGRDYEGSTDDLSKAFGAFFGLGVVTTVAVLVVLWRMGVDLGRVI